MRYTGPKNKLARREGQDLGLKTVGSHAHASLLRRINIMPGAIGQKRRRKPSEFGLQLREKQKTRRIYGLTEKQFKNLFEEAFKKKGSTGERFLESLETRLDNIVYRLAFTPTRTFARQLVGHGHILVDNKKVTIPSCRLRPDQIITLSAKALKIPVIAKLLEDKKPHLPVWLERKGPVGKVVRAPLREDIEEEIEEQLIVEYYSR